MEEGDGRQIPYDEQNKTVTQKRGGLFAVIEDVFYKSKYGAENPDLFPHYSSNLDSDQMRNESSYLYSTPDTVNMSGIKTLIQNEEPFNDESSEDTVHDKNSEVSLAPSPVTGPEYPNRPTKAPETPKPVSNDQRNIQPRQYDR
jgi:hypothetical protein